VERVTFGSSRPVRKPTTAGIAGRNKKRKRQNLKNEADIAELPQIWDRPIHRSGSSAVIVLVDRPSRETAWKGIRKCIKDGVALLWPYDEGMKIPSLGSKRVFHLRFPQRYTFLGN